MRIIHALALYGAKMFQGIAQSGRGPALRAGRREFDKIARSDFERWRDSGPQGGGQEARSTKSPGAILSVGAIATTTRRVKGTTAWMQEVE